MSVCVCAQSLQSCLTLCDPVGCSPPGSSAHGIFQARILEWVAVPSSRDSSQGSNPGIQPKRDLFCLFHWQAGSLPLVPPVRSEGCHIVLGTQSCLTLCSPIDCSPTPVFLPGESQGWGSLVGCCLWGCTESGTTEAT